MLSKLMVLILCSLFITGCVTTQEKTKIPINHKPIPKLIGIPVQIEGVAALDKGEKCYAEAKSNAVRNAVEKISGAEIKSITNVELGELVKDTISSKVSGYATHIQILQRYSKDDLCVVEIKTYINDIKVKRDVADAVAQYAENIKLPTVTLVAAIKGETGLPKNFARVHFSVNDLKLKLNAALKKYIKSVKKYEASDINELFAHSKNKTEDRQLTEVVQEIAKSTSPSASDYVVVAIVKPNVRLDRHRGAYRANTTIAIEIAQVGIGGIVAGDARSYEEYGDSPSTAAEKSIDTGMITLMSDLMRTQVLADFKNKDENGIDYAIRVSSVRNYSQHVRSLKKSIKSMDKTMDVNTSRYDKKRKIATFILRYKGSSEELDEALADELERSFNVEESGSNSFEITPK
ncbi:hypothetical protein [Candidatus Venteria ishoeyi]|uniref:Flagellar assembly protein T N-terminal domain-containing protein n=1 Tax=Candidatus Venteria ishoeyi TaxID=1899563 RepID=A0A1H6FEJ1_9GAMM|nr:hypothetical protein [Candidatus Venteria ishoeyi]SEH08498.1 Uncharacterised protein [Candidatus Venteria ishoeyi]